MPEQLLLQRIRVKLEKLLITHARLTKLPNSHAKDTRTMSSSCASSIRKEEVTVSAPGKILLVGGYLVLEEPNVGLVVAVDKRFYCRCSVIFGDTTTEIPSCISIRVHSPQFGSTWMYQYNVSKQRFLVNNNTEPYTTSSSNPFVEKALKVALLYLFPKTADHPSTDRKIPNEMELTIVADNDFYSLVPHLRQRHMPNTLAAAESLPSFLPVQRNDHGEVYKTGLGSSACLVTSLVGALVESVSSSSSEQNDVESQNNKESSSSPRPLNNITDIAKLSQIAHCYAQGKIGSGFDVSAACYGSHVYQRFPSHLLQELLLQLDQNGDSTTTNTTAASETLQQIMQMTWMGGVQKELHCFHSNSFLQVIMADVSGGSESPSMSKQVLQWKKQQQQASSQLSKIPHWYDLIQINQTIVDLLQELETMTSTTTIPSGDNNNNNNNNQQQNDTDWQKQKQWLIQNADRWQDVQAENALARVLVRLRTAFHDARYHLKHMGIAANQVPIEPDIQTELCDACQAVPGVIAALVPGAGGYDAVVVVYIHDESVRNAIANFWTQWKPKSHVPDHQHQEDATVVGPLTIQGANYEDGVRIEPRFPMPI